MTDPEYFDDEYAFVPFWRQLATFIGTLLAIVIIVWSLAPKAWAEGGNHNQTPADDVCPVVLSKTYPTVTEPPTTTTTPPTTTEAPCEPAPTTTTVPPTTTKRPQPYPTVNPSTTTTAAPTTSAPTTTTVPATTTSGSVPQPTVDVSPPADPVPGNPTFTG